MVAVCTARRIARSIASSVCKKPMSSTTGQNYQVRGFSDSNYFAGTNALVGKLGTVRMVFKLLSLPGSGQYVIFGRCDNTGSSGGWYLCTSFITANKLVLQHRNSVGGYILSDGYVLNASDIGSLFVIHATASDNDFTHFYLGGMEVGTPVATNTLLTARTNDLAYIGRYQWNTGFSTSAFGIIDLAVSSSVMTPQQVYKDAYEIMASVSQLTISDIPSQSDRFKADSLVSATNWVSTDSSLTLTRNGSLTVDQF